MVESGKQLVAIYGVISPHSCPASYSGVTWLADKGKTFVRVLLPYGVRQFPKVPCKIKVPVDTMFVEYRENERPVLTVNYWEPYVD